MQLKINIDLIFFINEYALYVRFVIYDRAWVRWFYMIWKYLNYHIYSEFYFWMTVMIFDIFHAGGDKVYWRNKTVEFV